LSFLEPKWRCSTRNPQHSPAGKPGAFASDEAKKVEADFLAAVKDAKTRYGQDLGKAKEAVAARQSSATDSLTQEALRKELDAIIDEITRLHAELAGAAPPAPAKPAFSPVGVWIEPNTKSRFNFLADGRLVVPDAKEPQYAEGTWKVSGGKLAVTFKNGEVKIFEIPDPSTLISDIWRLQREPPAPAGK
jgi:hypothetical protein